MQADVKVSGAVAAGSSRPSASQLSTAQQASTLDSLAGFSITRELADSHGPRRSCLRGSRAKARASKADSQRSEWVLGARPESGLSNEQSNPRSSAAHSTPGVALATQSIANGGSSTTYPGNRFGPQVSVSRSLLLPARNPEKSD